MPTKFLYFDLGNVLLTFSNEQACAQLAALAGMDTDKVVALLLGPEEKSSLLWQFEQGDLDGDEFYRRFCDVTGSAPDRAALEHAASDMFQPIDASFRLVEALSAAGHRLGILSNTNPYHWRFVTDGRFPPLNRFFDLTVTSFDARAMKPDPRIYQFAIQRAGVSAEEIFFVDDRQENVAGAVDAGIDAVRYLDHQTLLEDLAQRGIQPLA